MKLVLIAGALGCAGYVGYGFFVDPFGRSPATPLGEFGKIDVHLTEDLGMERSEPEEVDFREVGSYSEAYRYLGHMPTISNWGKDTEEFVHVLLDANGDIVGVSASGILPVARMGQGSAVLKFMFKYWKSVSGSAPERRDVGYGKVARFTGDGAAGVWQQGDGEGAGFRIRLYRE